MSARQTMTMRAVLQKNIAPIDPYGHKGAPDWKTIDSNLPCLIWETSAHTIIGTITYEIGTPMGIFPKSTSIMIDDRLESVSDRIGTEKYGKLGITAIMRRRDHIQAVLKREN